MHDNILRFVLFFFFKNIYSRESFYAYIVIIIDSTPDVYKISLGNKLQDRRALCCFQPAPNELKLFRGLVKILLYASFGLQIGGDKSS